MQSLTHSTVHTSTDLGIHSVYSFISHLFSTSAFMNSPAERLRACWDLERGDQLPEEVASGTREAREQHPPGEALLYSSKTAQGGTLGVNSGPRTRCFSGSVVHSSSASAVEGLIQESASRKVAGMFQTMRAEGRLKLRLSTGVHFGPESDAVAEEGVMSTLSSFPFHSLPVPSSASQQLLGN